MNLPLLLDPHSRLPLTRDSAHSLTDGEHRYPVISGIPYLRTNRDDLCKSAVAALDLGDEQTALLLVLADQDDWARSAPPSADTLKALLQPKTSLRDAMQALNFGAVADYFAYRWSDPTFLSGLALLQAHLPAGARVLELGCGIGHYLREFEMRGIEAVGADVVFAKLWLARRYVAPGTPLLCFDAGAPFPLRDQSVEAVFCHDAFYFFPAKAHCASELRRIAGESGTVLIGHTHNAAAENLSAGEPLTEAEYAALFPGSVVYDDEELTRSWIERRGPEPGVHSNAAALAFATQEAHCELNFGEVTGPLLRLNPLFKPGQHRPEWPSERYKQEYEALSDYLMLEALPVAPTPDLVRRRVFLSLPEQW